MKERLQRLLSMILIAMFVNYMFSNIVFMHTHADAAGNPITHSHPYSSSSSHTHTSGGYALIASFNAAASSFQGVAALSIASPVDSEKAVYASEYTILRSAELYYLRLRTPPAI